MGGGSRAFPAARHGAILNLAMKVTKERIPESQVLLEIEIDEERLERSMEKAYRRLAGRTKVPGFRKGKVPRAMLERYVGRDALVREALDDAVPAAYREAIEQEEIDPIDQPDLEIVTLEPLVSFKATVPVAPVISLGDYRSVRLDPPMTAVEESEIDDALQDLRRRYATIAPVDRAVGDGDIVRCDVHAWVDDESILEEIDVQFPVHKGGTVSLPGFSDAMIGLTKGGPHAFTIDVADDFPERAVAGKTVRYSVDVKEVKEEQLPELDDGFARTVGEGFDTLDELRGRLRDDILENKKRAAEDEYESRVLAAIADGVEAEFPPVLVEREIERLIHDRTGHGSTRDAFDTYLQQIGKSEDELKAELRPDATERVLRSLVLTELSRAESIEIPDEDVEAEIDRMAGTGAQAQQVRQVFANESGRDVIRRSLLTRRTFERIASLARGDGAPPSPSGPDDGDAATDAPAKPTRRRSQRAAQQES